MNVKDGLAVDDLLIKWMRGLVSDRDFDRLVAGTTRNKADLGFALGALACGGGGHFNCGLRIVDCGLACGWFAELIRNSQSPIRNWIRRLSWARLSFGWRSFRAGRCPCGACAVRGFSPPDRSACAA